MWEVHGLYVSVLNKMKRDRRHGIEVSKHTVFDVLRQHTAATSAPSNIALWGYVVTVWLQCSVVRSTALTSVAV